MVVHIKNRKSSEIAFGPYISMSTARRAFMSRGLDAAEYVFDDENWREREAARDNLIDLTEFGLTPITDHFLHISKKDEQDDLNLMVSFTLNEAKGRADRQEPGRRIGRYLKEFFPALSDDEITVLSGKLNGRYGKGCVKFAYTRQEIRRVYESRANISSCMSYAMSDYSSHNRSANVKPVEAYSGPDLAVAYTEDRHGNVTARAVVWPEKKIYGRVYAGDSGKFETQLQALGYQYGSLRGARLTPIELGRDGATYYFAAPYIDGNDQILSFDGEWFYIGSHRDRDSYNTGTSGCIVVTQYICVITNKRIRAGNAHGIRDSRANTVYVDYDLIGTADYEAQVQRFSRREYWMGGPDDQYYFTADGLKFPIAEAGRSFLMCAYNGKYYPAAELIDGVHHKALIEHYTRCEMTGVLLRKDDTYRSILMPHGAYWSRAAFDNWGYTDANGVRRSKIHDSEPQAQAA